MVGDKDKEDIDIRRNILLCEQLNERIHKHLIVPSVYHSSNT